MWHFLIAYTSQDLRSKPCSSLLSLPIPTPTSTFPGPQALNTFSTPSFGPPTFSSIVTPDLDPSSIATPTENSSDGSTVPYSESTVPRKDNNWRTLVINANSIANKKLN